MFPEIILNITGFRITNNLLSYLEVVFICIIILISPKFSRFSYIFLELSYGLKNFSDSLGFPELSDFPVTEKRNIRDNNNHYKVSDISLILIFLSYSFCMVRPFSNYRVSGNGMETCQKIFFRRFIHSK